MANLNQHGHHINNLDRSSVYGVCVNIRQKHYRFRHRRRRALGSQLRESRNIAKFGKRRGDLPCVYERARTLGLRTSNPTDAHNIHPHSQQQYFRFPMKKVLAQHRLSIQREVLRTLTASALGYAWGGAPKPSEGGNACTTHKKRSSRIRVMRRRVTSRTHGRAPASGYWDCDSHVLAG